MAVAKVKNLFTGSNKTSNASFAITGSLTITVGNRIFLALACDTGGSAHGVTDNLLNTYTIVEEVNNSGNVRAILFSAPVTVGGTLTTQTIAWTTNITAKAAASAEFSGVGEFKEVGEGVAGDGIGGLNCTSNVAIKCIPSGGLVVGAAGLETDTTPTSSSNSGDPSLSSAEAGGTHTTGAGAASNIGGLLCYALGVTTPSAQHVLVAGGAAVDNAGAGGIYYMSESPQEASPYAPLTNVTDNSGIGTVAWVNPGRGVGPDNAYATVILLAAQTSHYLKYLNFKFALASGMIPTGIEVQVECKQTLVLTQSLSVRLVIGGTVSGNTYTVEIPQTEAYLTFGGPGDLWGLSLLDTDVESATFGCVLWIDTAAADTYSVDDAYMKVYFAAAPAIFVPIRSRRPYSVRI